MAELNRKIEKVFKVVLRHSGKEYVVYDDYYLEAPNDISQYMWEEGNYSCDCNKSLFIQRQCDEEFPDMTCGDTIELVSWKQIKEIPNGK